MLRRVGGCYPLSLWWQRDLTWACQALQKTYGAEHEPQSLDRLSDVVRRVVDTGPPMVVALLMERGGYEFPLPSVRVAVIGHDHRLDCVLLFRSLERSPILRW